MKLRHVAAAAAATLLVATLATPATALDDPVDIYAELDLPSWDAGGPRTFEVTGVVTGDGPELTGADETANPSDWCGDILIDVDPVAQTITVRADQENTCYFETAVVRITTTEIATLEVVDDSLMVAYEDDGETPRPEGATLVTETAPDGVTMSWSMIDGYEFYLEGTAVFSYTEVADVPVTPATPAAPVIVAPAFTG